MLAVNAKSAILPTIEINGDQSMNFIDLRKRKLRNFGKYNVKMTIKNK